MNGLYPLKFESRYFEKIWGGKKIHTVLDKDCGDLPNCGESWEISGVEDNVSVVSNGFLAGNTLQELIEIYMGDLVGERIYEKHGIEFPLLVKFIDAHADLSIQVHPDDPLAKERHNAYGKTEMWYVLDAEKGARLNSGFNRPLTREEFVAHLNGGRLLDILSYEEVQKGDVFFLLAGRVHALGAGILVAEIQQTSDVTYRIHDFDRTDAQGRKRDLHTDLALDAIHFDYQKTYKKKYQEEINNPTELVHCDYFTTNLLVLNKTIARDFYSVDSFVIYVCLEGELELNYSGGSGFLKKGETLLVPASIPNFSLRPFHEAVRLLEVFIPNA